MFRYTHKIYRKLHRFFLHKRLKNEDVESLRDVPCKNKMVFTIKEYPHLDYVMKLPKDPDKDCVNMYMFDKSKILARYRWEREWDFVSWLNK